MPIFPILEKVAETQNTVKKEKCYLSKTKMKKNMSCVVSSDSP